MGLTFNKRALYFITTTSTLKMLDYTAAEQIRISLKFVFS